MEQQTELLQFTTENPIDVFLSPTILL